MTSSLAIRAVLSNWAAFAVAAGISFVSTPIIVRELGIEQYGLWSVVMAFTGYYGLIRLGTRSGVTKYVAQYNAIGDAASLNNYVSTSLSILMVVAAVTLVASAMIALLFPLIIICDPKHLFATRAAVMVMGINAAASFPCDAFGGVLAGLKRFDLSNAVGIGSVILRTTLMVIGIKCGGGLLAMAILASVVDVSSNLVQVWLAFHQCRNLRITLCSPISLLARQLVGFNFFSFLCGTSDKVINSADTIIVGALLGATHAGYYAVAERLVSYVGALTRGISTVISPFASEFDAMGHRNRLQQLVIYSARAGLQIGLFASVIIVFLGRPFLGLWLGESFETAFLVLCLLTIPRIGMMTQSMLVAGLIGINKHRFVGILFIVEAIANIAISLLLARPLGLVGVALGTVIPVTISRCLIVPVFGCRALGVPLVQYLTKAILPPLFATFPCVLLGLAFAAGSAVEEWRIFFLRCCAFLFVGSVAGYVFCWRNEINLLFRRRVGDLSKTTPAAAQSE